MFTITETDDSITIAFSSVMSLIDRPVKECCEFLARYDFFDLTGIKLILRELLNNAVEHGNQNIIEQITQCSVRCLGGKRFAIVVEDQGRGFDYNSLVMALPENPKQVRQRGYSLINAIADRLEWNDTGNRITAYFCLSPETVESVHEDNWRIIRPSGDITANVAEKLRNLLLKSIDEGYRQIRLDFNKVENVDSVGLTVFVVFSSTLKEKDLRAELEIINANHNLRRIFQIMQLDDRYKVTGYKGGSHGNKRDAVALPLQDAARE